MDKIDIINETNKINEVMTDFEKSYDSIKNLLVDFVYVYSKLLAHIYKACELYKQYDTNKILNGFTKNCFNPKSFDNILYAQLCMSHYKKSINTNKELYEIIYNINKTTMLLYDDKKFTNKFQNSYSFLMYILVFFDNIIDDVFRYAYIIEKEIILLDHKYLCYNIKIINKIFIEIFDNNNLSSAQKIIFDLKCIQPIEKNIYYIVNKLKNEFTALKDTKENIHVMLFRSHVNYLHKEKNNQNAQNNIETIINTFSDNI